MRLKSDAVVIRLHMGQNLESKQRNQHCRQHVCQHWVETVGSVYGSRQILHAGTGLDCPGWESKDGRLVRGTEGPVAFSISTIVSDSLLALKDLDADKTSTSVNCALPKTTWSSPSTSISSSTSSWFVFLMWKPEAVRLAPSVALVLLGAAMPSSVSS